MFNLRMAIVTPFSLLSVDTFQPAKVTSENNVPEPRLTVLFWKMTDILAVASGRFRVIGDGAMRSVNTG